MSGGSFNYLCHKDASELLSSGLSDLRHMVDELRSLPGAKAAYEDSLRALVLAEEAQRRLQELADGLRPVWQSVEWWRSCDSSREDAIAACAVYGEKEAP